MQPQAPSTLWHVAPLRPPCLATTTLITLTTTLTTTHTTRLTSTTHATALVTMVHHPRKQVERHRDGWCLAN